MCAPTGNCQPARHSTLKKACMLIDDDGIVTAVLLLFSLGAARVCMDGDGTVDEQKNVGGLILCF